MSALTIMGVRCLAVVGHEPTAHVAVTNMGRFRRWFACSLLKQQLQSSISDNAPRQIANSVNAPVHSANDSPEPQHDTVA